MARRIAIPVTGTHPDGSTCTHPVTSTGRPKHPDCTGRTGYRAHCTADGCDWSTENTQRVIVTDRRARHLADHTHQQQEAAR
ncbi:hypothetical protein [Streptomyces radiopugnans]|uniref:hypothetical protein n=1 Tax=Streptomyces radiopugnans TaxID=403935 RepID=UPI003F1DAE0A